MKTQDIRRIQQSYQNAASACSVNSSQTDPLHAANNLLLLNRILSRVTKGEDRILDLGCSSCAWTTNYLNDIGYETIGVEVDNRSLIDNELSTKLDIPLVNYDGYDLPFVSDSFDLVLMFGVLEHVGVVKENGQKYNRMTDEVTPHRKQLLDEVQRVLREDGALYITRYPNLYCRNAVISKLINRRVGHLDSERARPRYLKKPVKWLVYYRGDGYRQHTTLFISSTSTTTG